MFLSQEIPKRLQGIFVHRFGQAIHIVELDRAMGNCQGDHQTSEPAMHEIEILERNSGEEDQWVIAACYQNQGDHVGQSQDSEPVSKMPEECHFTAMPLDTICCESDVQNHDAKDQHALEAGR